MNEAPATPTSGNSISFLGLSRWNLLARGIIVATALSILLFLPHFIDHFQAHISGSIAPDVVVGQWHVVIANIAIFLSFLIPLSFRRKVDWKEYTLVGAFIVSLFVEMYGIPLLILLIAGPSAGLAGAPSPGLLTPFNINFLGVQLYLSIPMTYGLIIMTVGSILIVVAWYQLFRGIKQGKALVTTGVYAVSRNPQYLGFILIIVGWWFGWPTLLVNIFAPILLVMYVRLCYVEEAEIDDLDGFEEWKERVPRVV